MKTHTYINTYLGAYLILQKIFVIILKHWYISYVYIGKLYTFLSTATSEPYEFSKSFTSFSNYIYKLYSHSLNVWINESLLSFSHIYWRLFVYACLFRDVGYLWVQKSVILKTKFISVLVIKKNYSLTKRNGVCGIGLLHTKLKVSLSLYKDKMNCRKLWKIWNIIYVKLRQYPTRK